MAVSSWKDHVLTTEFEACGEHGFLQAADSPHVGLGTSERRGRGSKGGSIESM